MEEKQVRNSGRRLVQMVLIAYLLVLWIGCYSENVEASTPGVRGMWISFLDYEAAGLYNKPEGEFRQNANLLFEELQSYGINHVYFQVRAFDDAIYPSKYFKFSKYMAKGTPNYDPLHILIEAAHSHKISFHAWINPYRITYDKIYNPAEEATIKRIVNGVMEIVVKYKVDGIQFDDYFYPAKGEGQPYSKVSVAKRKQNVNKMLREVYRQIKKKDSSVVFGVSPAGERSYAESIGCDISTWLSQKGYMDYIIPQIYWSNQYKMNGKVCSLFSSRLEEWNMLNQNNTPMYIGLGLYRAGMASDVDLQWTRSTNVISGQIKELTKKGNKGYVLFSYRFIKANDACKKEMKNYLKQLRKPKVNVSRLTITAGEQKALKVSVWPRRASQKVSWKIFNSKKLKMKKNFIVAGKRAGTTVITLKAGANEKRVTVKVLPPKARGLKVKKQKKACKISWKKVKHADGYVIYRSRKQKGPFKRIQKVKKNYILVELKKKKKKYYYRIKAYEKISGKTYYSKASNKVQVRH